MYQTGMMHVPVHDHIHRDSPSRARRAIGVTNLVYRPKSSHGLCNVSQLHSRRRNLVQVHSFPEWLDDVVHAPLQMEKTLLVPSSEISSQVIRHGVALEQLIHRARAEPLNLSTGVAVSTGDSETPNHNLANLANLLHDAEFFIRTLPFSFDDDGLREWQIKSRGRKRE